MRAPKKETKKYVSSNAGQTISGRILVADDNKAIREIVSSLLEFIGFEVALACNGIEALAVFLKSSFDLVLTDLEMPVMDGWSLTRSIKERSPNTPVVLMTGADRETVLKKVVRVPVDSVIFKPFGLEDLRKTVQGALDLRDGALTLDDPLSVMNRNSEAHSPRFAWSPTPSGRFPSSLQPVAGSGRWGARRVGCSSGAKKNPASGAAGAASESKTDRKSS
jgi:CheY-like chemotaxis protein